MNIYLIHNGARKLSAIENIKNGINFSFNLVEIYSQKKGSLSFCRLLMTRLLIFGLEIRSLLRVNYSLKGLAKLLVSEIYKVLILLMFKSKRNSSLGRGWIVYSISSKHIRGWKKMVACNDPYAIFFEDDVISKRSSAKHISNLMNILCKKKFEGYVDLAGGFDLVNILEGWKTYSVLNRGCELVEPDSPRSNTACGYILSKNLASEFLKILALNGDLRFLPIDFIINYCLERVSKREFRCLHSAPSIFKHGSFVGQYKTWDV